MPRQYWHLILTTCALLAFCLGCNRQAPSTSASNPSTTENNNPITNMVLIQPGAFQRGNFRVTLTQPYWIGKYEVTQGEYEALMKTNTSYFPGDPNRPVEKVKFIEAAAYCAELTKRAFQAGRLQPRYSYRLPTEAEWEYACRAGTTHTNLLSF